MKRGQPAREEASPPPPTTCSTRAATEASQASIVRREILDTRDERIIRPRVKWQRSLDSTQPFRWQYSNRLRYQV